jgi:hypothetical protein
MNFATFSALHGLRTPLSVIGGAVSGWGAELLSPVEKLVQLAENMPPFIIYGDLDEETAKAMGLISKLCTHPTIFRSSLHLRLDSDM